VGQVFILHGMLAASSMLWCHVDQPAVVDVLFRPI
jgi:hypothetical protein